MTASPAPLPAVRDTGTAAGDHSVALEVLARVAGVQERARAAAVTVPFPGAHDPGPGAGDQLAVWDAEVTARTGPPPGAPRFVLRGFLRRLPSSPLSPFPP